MRIEIIAGAGLAIALAGCAKSELPLSNGTDGATVFGDARLSVRFDPATGWPTDYRVNGYTLLTGDGEFPAPVIVGLEHWRLPDPKKSPKVRRAGDVVRIAADEVRSSTFSGDWRLDAYVKLLPERRMVRRRFDVTWLGESETGKLERVWVLAGKMPCRDGKGGYLLPAHFPRSPRYTAEAKDFKPGHPSWTDVKFESHTPVIASGSDGWSVLSANDETVPFGERTQSMAVERRDGVSVATWFECYGWMPKGVKQTFGDNWLHFTEGDCDTALRRMGEWFDAVGQRIVPNRSSTVKDTALYSDHPQHCGELGAAKLGFKHLATYLPFIRELGFNTVWLRPVEDKSPYNPRDYYKLQADVGSEDDFRSYVKTAHGLGLKVWRDAVSHGGRNDTDRAKAHPEWLARHEDGSSDSFWCYDFFNPGWLDFMREFVRHETEKYDLDGWRMDAPSGSRYPNWSRTIPYARASLAQEQGSLAMIKAIREGLRAVKPDGATLSEAHMNVQATRSDAIYDNWGIAQIFLSTLSQCEIDDAVDQYRHYLYERKWSFLPDHVTMRYTENHDHISAASIYGKLPALATFAVQAWIEGFPCVWETIEEGSFEEYREILRIRAALEELRRGDADYLGVRVPGGVFACRRWTKDLESLVFVNFNPKAVSFDAAGRRLELAPYAYRVVRTKGPSVDEALGRLKPVDGVAERARPLEVKGPHGSKILPLDLGGGRKTELRVELRDAKNEWVTRLPYDIKLENKDGRWMIRALDRKGLPMKGVKLFVQVPAVTRWYARTAEGDFNNPQFVRCPAFNERHYSWGFRHSMQNGARRWCNRAHPFGLTEERAAVGGVLADGTALEFTGFEADAFVEVRDRILKDSGFTLVLADMTPQIGFRVTKAPADVKTAHENLTGDGRLSVIAGGWLWDDGKLRLRIRRSGAIDGIWKNENGKWRHVARIAEFLTTTGSGTENCIGSTSGVCRQRNDNDPRVRLSRQADGSVVFEFSEVWPRGGAADSGRMKVPIVCAQRLTLGRADGFGLEFSFTTGRDIAAAEGDVRYEICATGPQGKVSPFEIENLVLTGAVRGQLVREGGTRRIYWLKKGGVDLPTQKSPVGFSCFIKL